MTLKAIETVYNGYKFRSRLEARWAVFFDTLKVEYLYESEGFDLGDGIWYLPDFYIPLIETWIEIKPIKPSQEEIIKAEKLHNQSKKDVIILFGSSFKFEVKSGAIQFPRIEIRDRHLVATMGQFFINIAKPKLMDSRNRISINDALNTARQTRFEHNDR